MFAEFWTDYDYIIPLSRSWVRAFKSFAHEHSGISRNNARLSERILSAAFYIATSLLYLHSLPTSFNLHSCRFWEYIYFFNLTFFFLHTHRLEHLHSFDVVKASRYNACLVNISNDNTPGLLVRPNILSMLPFCLRSLKLTIL